jgi:hypothetical protein
MAETDRTTIYRTRSVDAARTDEEAVGYVDAVGAIYRLRWGNALEVGRADAGLRIFRATQHGEGGDVGWMDPDGIVIQAGMILGEEEVGRVEGPHALAAAAALLLLFLPDEAEADRRATR